MEGANSRRHHGSRSTWQNKARWQAENKRYFFGINFPLNLGKYIFPWPWGQGDKFDLFKSAFLSIDFDLWILMSRLNNYISFNQLFRLLYCAISNKIDKACRIYCKMKYLTFDLMVKVTTFEFFIYLFIVIIRCNVQQNWLSFWGFIAKWNIWPLIFTFYIGLKVTICFTI